jgi:hypothetical protein
MRFTFSSHEALTGVNGVPQKHDILTNRPTFVYVPKPWLGHIQPGEQVTVRVDSDPGKAFSGVVEQIARAAEFTPRNVQTVGERIKQVFGIKVRLDNREGKLRAGMAADVTFPNVAAP